MAGVAKKPRSGKYRGWFINAAGKQEFFTGGRDRAETLRMARRLEDDHRQVRLGYRPARSKADKHATDSFVDVAQAYLDWGQTQGGRGGRPWSKGHAERRCRQLEFWRKRLQLRKLGDLIDILPAVERVAQERLKEVSGKTVKNQVEGLGALSDWCVDRGYLDQDPLRAIAPFDTTAVRKRRAATRDELVRLLEASPPERRLLYETAFASGLRANELRSLTRAHLDRSRGGLHLDAAWTKNRKPGFQLLPDALLERLEAHAADGVPAQLYEAAYHRGSPKGKPPADPLLYVPSHPARSLYRDLDAAGVERETAAGRLDFHALRVAYISGLLEDPQVSAKEVQELARHASLDLTMHTYGRAREERLRAAVDRLYQGTSRRPENATSMPRPPRRQNEKSATPSETRGCASNELAPAVGFESGSGLRQIRAEITQEAAKVLQLKALDGSSDDRDQHICALCGHSHGTSEQDPCVPCAYIDEGLARLMVAWPRLDDAQKERIGAILVRASEGSAA